MFKKNIFSLVLIAIVAISGVGLYALQLPVAEPSPIIIQVKMDDMNAGGNNYIELDTILNGRGFKPEVNQEIMNGIESKLNSKNGITAHIGKDSKGVNYLVVSSDKPERLNFTEQVAYSVTGTERTNYNLSFDCTFTPIETQINLDSSTGGEIDQNTIIYGTVKAVKYYDKDEWVESKNYTGPMKVNINSLDNPFPINTNYSIHVYDGKTQFKPNDDPSIANGRPGNYNFNFNVDNSLYSKFYSTIKGEQFDYYRITHVKRDVFGGLGTLGTTPKPIYTEVSGPNTVGFYGIENNIGSFYQVTDYFGNPVKDIPVEVSGNSITSDLTLTNGDGIIYVTRYANFYDDVNHNLNIKLKIPAKAGVYKESVYEDTQNVQRIATGNEKIWIKASGNGIVTTENTWTAPNGISITAKGGIVGFAGKVTAQFFDKDGNLISEDHKTVRTADEKSIDVPKNAATVVYVVNIVGCDPKITTGQVPVGDAAIYFEGALHTTNCHIKAKDLNGYQFLKLDK